jgi:hypothetical protein
MGTPPPVGLACARSRSPCRAEHAAVARNPWQRRPGDRPGDRRQGVRPGDWSGDRVPGVRGPIPDVVSDAQLASFGEGRHVNPGVIPAVADLQFGAAPTSGQGVLQVLPAGDPLAVDRHDDVAALQPCAVGRAAGLDVADPGPAVGSELGPNPVGLGAETSEAVAGDRRGPPKAAPSPCRCSASGRRTGRR